MVHFWFQVYNFCRQVTQDVSRKLVVDFGQLEASQKEDGSLVTEADQWADREIRQAIKQCFPTHGVLTEETEHILPPNDWCWVIDPIDGTTNFTHGVSVWGISIGLLYKGTPVFGFIHFPPIEQTYHGYYYGDTGLTGPQGSFLNNRPISTSSANANSSQVFTVCTRSLRVINEQFPCKVRVTGVTSYDLSLIACGATIGTLERSPKIWDIAGGYPILKGAGGIFISLQEHNQLFPLIQGVNYGKVAFPCLAIAHENLHPQFYPLTNKIRLAIV